MRPTEQRYGLRMLKLRDVLSRWDAVELSQLEAAELLRDAASGRLKARLAFRLRPCLTLW